MGIILVLFCGIKRFTKIVLAPFLIILYALGGRKDRLSSFLSSVSSNNNINVLSTLAFNYLSFPLRVCIKCPIYIYGSISFNNCGKIVISGPIYPGMIRINALNKRTMSKTRIENYGIIELQEKIRIFGGAHIVVSKNSKLLISHDVTICEDTLIWCENHIEIGEFTDISYCSQIFDSNSHFTVDLNTGIVTPYSRPVKIGKRNWIANHCTIKPGVITKDDIMIASSYSVVMPKLNNVMEPYSVLGGSPATVIKNKKVRIYDTSFELELYKMRFEGTVYKCSESELNHILNCQSNY